MMGNKDEIKKKLSSIRAIQSRMQKEPKEAVFSLEYLDELFRGMCIRYGYTCRSMYARYELQCKKGEDIPVNFGFYTARLERSVQPVHFVETVYGSDLWELFSNLILSLCDDVKKVRKQTENEK